MMGRLFCVCFVNFLLEYNKGRRRVWTLEGTSYCPSFLMNLQCPSKFLPAGARFRVGSDFHPLARHHITSAIFFHRVMSNAAGKRKANVPATDVVERKRVKLNTGAAAKANPKVQKSNQDTETSGQIGPSTAENSASASQPAAPNSHPRPRIRKLAPPRPFPTVALSAPATAPRSLHKEGKNHICITRRTKLAAYLRRCKALVVEDGFKEIRLSAMGAAIPHLALLAGSLPQIVPGDLTVEVQTGSVDVVDQMLEVSGDEDGGDDDKEFRTRVKSTMNVVIRVGGQGEPKTISNSAKGSAARSGKASSNRRDVQPLEKPEQIIFQEPEQDQS
jgi:hypothetical protein